MRYSDPIRMPREAPPPQVPEPRPATPAVADTLNLGREKLVEWGPEIWERIDRAAVEQIDRSSVAMQFLPRVESVAPSARTVPANMIVTSEQALSVDQTNVLPLLERAQQFFLSKEQYYDESAIGTAATLASRAANRLGRSMDEAIFVGEDGGGGMLAAAGRNYIVDVPRLNQDTAGVYGENVFTAVSKAYAQLQARSLYGPYALVLAPAQYADAHAPLASTLIMPADRIRPLMTAGFHASGTLPDGNGVIVSLGGTIDLAVAVHGATAFTLVNPDETRWFRIYERFALRIKDADALVQLRFG